ATRCDRVALIQRGRLLATDTPQRIAASFDRPLLAVTATDRYRALLALRERTQTEAVYPFGETLHYADSRADAPADAVAADVREVLAARGFAGVTVESAAPAAEGGLIARTGAPGRGAPGHPTSARRERRRHIHDCRAGDRRARPDAPLRRFHRRRPDHVRRPRRRGVRLPWRQRRRQDHRDPDADRAAGAVERA